jgi:hypothetical protein
MMAHSAWDFYFDRAERGAIIERLRTRRDCPAEEMCLRSGKGKPVWVLATRRVARDPEIFQSTVIDITLQKKTQARLRDLNNARSVGREPSTQNTRMAELLRRLAFLLSRVNGSLEPSNLSTIDKSGVEKCVLALEEMKMLMAELEIIHLLGERRKTNDRRPHA